MFNWLKIKNTKISNEDICKKFQLIFYMLLNLYQNTWDKKLVKQITREIVHIYEKEFYKNENLCKLINKILNSKE